MIDYLKVDLEPKYIQVVSEPYVVFTVRGYAPVIDIIERKSRHATALFISAKSLAQPLEMLKKENGDLFSGLEFWIRKASDGRTAPYILEEG